MPWYGMHLIDRVRNQAAATEREQRRPEHGDTAPPSRTAQLLDATPTLAVVALWAMFGAVLYCAASGISEWDIVVTVAIGPMMMLVAGLVWGSQKHQLTSGFDAAIIIGAVVGGLFVIAAMV